jgi:hypothetical protein
MTRSAARSTGRRSVRPAESVRQGNISQAARDFVLQDTTSVGQIKQQVFSA